MDERSMSEIVRARNRWLARQPLKAQPAEMIAQELWHYRYVSQEHQTALSEPPAARIVAGALLCVTLIATFAFSSALWTVLALHNGGTPLHYLFLGTSALLFAWISFGAANAVAGACFLLAGTGGDSIAPAVAKVPRGVRTALLYPIYHEDAGAIACAIRDLVRDLNDKGALHAFAFFVISDSQTLESKAAERDVFKRLSKEMHGKVTFGYRNRTPNVGKKAGNIADWVRTLGGGYDYFVVFDADSVMSAETLMQLVGTMQAHPDTALVQTVPRLSHGRTVFSRLQAFANNTLGPLSAAGLAGWQGASGNYWGHNAIIRTRAFATSAGLPVLPGDAPWGGHIQSHDFVEAALLRRAGWRVALLTSLEGTYEQSPPTFVDMAVRDRRWMQGNLQHSRILGARGLTPVSRIHLGMGIASYISSALWLLVILLGLWLIWLEQQRVVSYFDSTKSLFPNWPTYDPVAALRLLMVTMLVVLLPKLLGLAMALGQLVRDRKLLEKGGQLVSLWGTELVHSVLVAPVTMLNHVRTLVELLRRQDTGWKSQRRQSMIIPLMDALRFHRIHVSVGVLLAGAAASLSWYALGWLMPVIMGLVLSPFLTWATSHPIADQRP
jgi:membrane glycosyltransferase